MPLPVGTPHADLTLLQIYVSPFERHDFPASQASVPAQQNDEVRDRIARQCRLDQPLVVSRVVERRRRPRDRQQPDAAGQRFWYFGGNAPVAPAALGHLMRQSPGHRRSRNPEDVAALQAWLQQRPPGVSGEPFISR